MKDLHWTVGGFLIFQLYIIASVQSWRAAEFIESGDPGSREHLVWRIAAVVFCALAANTALRGLDRLTALFRSAAQAQGWYADRIPAQSALVVALLVICGLAIAAAAFWLRNVPLPSRLAFTTQLTLMSFLLVRAISLHAVDHMLFARFSGVSVSSAVEAGQPS